MRDLDQGDITVTVGGGCHYAGSVNYVVFGVMWGLCNTEVLARRDAASLAIFNLAFAEGMVRGWKWRMGARNTEASLNWMRAGWDGWPGKATPAPDRSHCPIDCAAGPVDPKFDYTWYQGNAF